MMSEEYSRLPVAVFEQGSFFGGSEVLKNARRRFSVSALAPLEALVLEKRAFRRIFYRQFPALGQLFLGHVDRRLKSVQAVLEMIDAFFNPSGANRAGRKAVERVRREGKAISRLSRKSSWLRSRRQESSLIKRRGW